jgi:hypothetical protein
VKEWSREV